MTGFPHAFMASSLLAVFGLAFLLAGDGALLLAGMYGEEYTREELRTARKRNYMFGAVHNIELGPQDVDHLVITPFGVLPTETKWRFRGGRPSVAGVFHKPLERGDVRRES